MEIHYEQEEGVVRRIRDGRAVIAVVRKNEDKCGSCCSCGSTCDAEFEVTVPDQGYQVDQHVVVSFPALPKLFSAGILFVLPIVAAVVLGALGSMVRIPSVDPSAGAAAGAIIGFIGAFVVAILVNNAISKRYPILVTPHPGPFEEKPVEESVARGS